MEVQRNCLVGPDGIIVDRAKRRCDENAVVVFKVW